MHTLRDNKGQEAITFQRKNDKEVCYHTSNTFRQENSFTNEVADKQSGGSMRTAWDGNLALVKRNNL